ncbi:TM2 domain-containing protein [Aceticella autotrophica]|uniref:TM2 domain-containing protein n=1 Tax=Aceticella autotrophica TaxID=2755338 RepID=A0A975GBC9_9THEO|nr:TM2 domain-containing protein [Aceticella autotrophica]QSZ28046.1 TM2 domain-containing protein [Aceticella autotrophica]
MSEVLYDKQKLTEKQLSILSSEMEKYKKSTTVAYLLWLFLGGLGAHKFYLGKIGMGFLYLSMFIIGWLTVGIYIGIVILIILGIFLIYDLFTIPSQIKSIYEYEEKRTIDRLLSINNYLSQETKQDQEAKQDEAKQDS